ncbi:hypothetical protein [Halovulum sp. GXIMD14793]
MKHKKHVREATMKELKEIAARAGTEAAFATLSEGIPIVFRSGADLCRLWPDGHVEKLAEDGQKAATKPRKRWPQYDGWDELAEAIETLAKTCGAHAYCSQKYRYLNIELHRRDATREQFIALHKFADLIETLTDQG